MPARNDTRRRTLADTAIALLASDGAHGLTHRAVERAAGVPVGTVSNYFPSRDALFEAVAVRIGELHTAAMNETSRATLGQGRRQRAVTTALTASLLTAVTRDRDRYLALFELQAESLRRPALAPALQSMQTTIAEFTRVHHAATGLRVPAAKIPLLMELYGAVLHSLLLRPPGTVDRATVTPLVTAIVRGTLRD